LMVGHSPHCDQAWISTIVGIRLPLYPRLRIRLMGQFPTELVRSVITGELNLALATAPSLNTDITAVSFAHTPLYAALPENHPAAENGKLELQDLADDGGSYFQNGCIRSFMKPSWKSPIAMESRQGVFTQQLPPNRLSNWSPSR
jgi:hypothetical protein